ncbi:MAG: EVE domain-containing protein, partial [Phycisphaerales bacterium]
MATFLIKGDPEDFGFADLVREGRSRWDGVANPTALIHLRMIRAGDELLVFHTGNERAVVGLA